MQSIATLTQGQEVCREKLHFPFCCWELLPEAWKEAGGEASCMWLPSSRLCLQAASLSDRKGQQQGWEQERSDSC